MADVAFSKIQKELAKDDRGLRMLSNGVHKKSISHKRSDAGSSATTKGKKIKNLFYNLIFEGRNKFFSYSFPICQRRVLYHNFAWISLPAQV